MAFLILTAFGAYAQQAGIDSSKVSNHKKYAKYIFTINPVRAATDEISINWDFLNENNDGMGFSIGYFRPHLMASSLSSLDGSENWIIRANSYGAVARFYKIWAVGRSFVQPTVRFKYHQVNDYTLINGNIYSNSTPEVDIARKTLAHGLNIKWGRNYCIKDVVVFRLYVGAGLDLYYNLHTEYKGYYKDGQTHKEVPEMYQLPLNKKFVPGITSMQVCG